MKKGIGYALLSYVRGLARAGASSEEIRKRVREKYGLEVSSSTVRAVTLVEK